MTKSELIELLAHRSKITKSRAELVVHCVIASMADSLRRGEHIEVRGFGSFTVRDYKPYTGRNPRTSETVAVEAKRLPFFKVGKELKKLVNESDAPALQADGEPAATAATAGKTRKRKPNGTP
ncbi:MAG: integration host factor subunit beta [Deltaproteobacteria bacterium]|nr:integration host factor subunit beta [Deltaproteobacteria bacterium]